jgi:hypothetical protein
MKLHYVEDESCNDIPDLCFRNGVIAFNTTNLSCIFHVKTGTRAGGDSSYKCLVYLPLRSFAFRWASCNLIASNTHTRAQPTVWRMELIWIMFIICYLLLVGNSALNVFCTNQKIASSIPDEVNFKIYLILQAALGPGVDLASNRNDCQKY